MLGLWDWGFRVGGDNHPRVVEHKSQRGCGQMRATINFPEIHRISFLPYLHEGNIKFEEQFCLKVVTCRA